MNANASDTLRGTELATKLLDALAQGNWTDFRACFAQGAKIWHNFDEVEQSVDATVEQLAAFINGLSALGYASRRAWSFGRLVFMQQVILAQLSTGPYLRIPAMMRLELDAGGKIVRLEEYLDTSPLPKA